MLLTITMVASGVPASALAQAAGQEPASVFSQVDDITAAAEADAAPAAAGDAGEADDAAGTGIDAGAGADSEGADPDGEAADAPDAEAADPGADAAPDGEPDGNAADNAAADPEDIALTYPAIEATAAATNGVIVEVSAPQGAFPAGTELRVQAVETERVLDAADAVLEGAPADAKAVDVSFVKDGRELEPADGASVSVKLRSVAAAVEGDSFSVVHLKDDGTAEVVPDADATARSASFEADDFSIYAIVGGVPAKTIVKVSFYNGTTLVAVQSVVEGDVLDSPDPVPTEANKARYTWEVLGEGQTSGNGTDLTSAGYFGKQLTAEQITALAAFGAEATDAGDRNTKVSEVKADVVWATGYIVSLHQGALNSDDLANNITTTIITDKDGVADLSVVEMALYDTDTVKLTGWVNESNVRVAGLDSITVSADTDLWPDIAQGKWFAPDTDCSAQVRKIFASSNGSGGYTVDLSQLAAATELASASGFNPGYDFAGWKLNGTGDNLNDSGTLTMAEADTIKAAWTPRNDTAYTIIHMVEGPESGPGEGVYTRWGVEVGSGTTGDVITNPAYGTSYASTTIQGYHIPGGDELGDGYSNNQTNVTIAGDGSALKIVYWNLNRYKLSFDIPSLNLKVTSDQIAANMDQKYQGYVKGGESVTIWGADKLLYPYMSNKAISQVSTTYDGVTVVLGKNQDASPRVLGMPDKGSISFTRDSSGDGSTYTVRRWLEVLEGEEGVDSTKTITVDGTTKTFFLYEETYGQTSGAAPNLAYGTYGGNNGGQWPYTYWAVWGNSLEGAPTAATSKRLGAHTDSTSSYGWTRDEFFTRDNQTLTYNNVDDMEISYDFSSRTIPFYTLLDSCNPGFDSTTTRKAEGTTYSFRGWYSDLYSAANPTEESSEAYSVDLDTARMPGGGLNLYASWVPVEHTVTFQPNGGTMADGATTQQVTSGTVATEPTTPTKTEGETTYTFAGWYSDEALTQPWDFVTDKVTSDMTLYARWISGASYKITYHNYAGTGTLNLDANSYFNGATATLASAPTAGQSGYSESAQFLAWSTEQDTAKRSQHTLGQTVVMDSDLDLYPAYGDVSYALGDGPTVYLNSNYPTRRSETSWSDVRTYTEGTQTARANTAIELPSAASGLTGADDGQIQVPAGYTFHAWNTQADGRGDTYQAGSDNLVGVQSDTDLYAMWSQTGDAITYHQNAGDSDSTTKTFSATTWSDHTVLAPASESLGFSYTGYHFTGWNTQADGNGTAYEAGGTYLMTPEDDDLYAQWERNTFTVARLGNVVYDGDAHQQAPVVTGYDGGEGKTLTPNTDYTVAYKRGDATTSDFTHVGTVTVVVTGIGEYAQADEVTLTHSITQATNEWTTEPAISGWTYDATASTPAGAAKFAATGEPKFEYKAKGAADGTYTTTQPTAAGDYTMRATVAATDDYTGLTATKDFTIAKAARTEAPTLALVKEATSATAEDGQASVTVTGDLPAQYSTDDGATWTDVPAGGTISNLPAGTLQVRYTADDNHEAGTVATLEVTYTISGTITWVHTYSYPDPAGSGTKSGENNDTTTERSTHANLHVKVNGTDVAEGSGVKVTANGQTTSGSPASVEAPSHDNNAQQTYTVSGLVKGTSYDLSAVATVNDALDTSKLVESEAYDVSQNGNDFTLSFHPADGTYKAAAFKVVLQSADCDTSLVQGVYVKVYFANGSSSAALADYGVISQQAGSGMGAYVALSGSGDSRTAEGSVSVWGMNASGSSSYYRAKVEGFRVDGVDYPVQGGQEFWSADPALWWDSATATEPASGSSSPMTVTIADLKVPMVELDANGGSITDGYVLASGNAEDGYTVAKSAIEAKSASWNGYEFDGWYETATPTATDKLSADITNLTQKKTLYAHWIQQQAAPTALDTTHPTAVLDEDGSVATDGKGEPSVNDDGSITGVDDTMEYRVKNDDGSYGEWTSVPAGATSVTGLAPGTYEVRSKAADATASDWPKAAGTPAEVTVAAKDLPDSAPAAPSASATTDNTTGKSAVTVSPAQAGQEYIILPKGTTPTADAWKNATTPTGGTVSFGDLTPGQEYTVYTRTAETDDAYPSAASSTDVTPDKLTQDAPAKPAATATSDNDTGKSTVAVTSPVDGQEYIILPAGTTPSDADWNNAKTGTAVSFDSLIPGQDYVVHTRKAGDATHDHSPATASDAVTTPKLDITVSDSAKPKAVDGLEYTGGAQALLTAPTTKPAGCEKVQYSADGGTTWTDTLPTGTDAGTYDKLQVKYVGDATHNDKVVELDAVSIGKATATVVIAATDRAYRAGDKAVDIAVARVDGAKAGETLSASIAGVTGSMADDAAGDGKAVTLTGEPTLTGATASNYEMAVSAVTVNISKQAHADQTATGQTMRGNTGTVDLSGLVVEGGTVGTPTVGGEAGVLDGTPQVSAGNKMSYTLLDDEGNVGKEATVTLEVTSANYATYKIVVTLTVLDKVSQDDFAFSGDAATGRIAKTYGDEGFSTPATGNESGTTVSYASSDESVATVDGNGNVTIVGAGTATITATASASADNYYKATARTYTLEVQPAELVVTAASHTIYVGTAAPDLSSPVEGTDYTVQGLVGADALTTAPTLAYQRNGAAATPDTSAPGTYAIVASGADAGANYTLRYVAGELIVSAKEQQEAPDAPEVEATTPTTLTVKAEPGQEYSIDGGATWVMPADGEDAVTFDGLTPGSAYEVVTRMAGDATHDPSPASEALSVTLPKQQQAAPAAPEAEATDAATVSVADPVAGLEYIILPEGAEPSEEDWLSAKTPTDGALSFTGLQPAAGYVVYARAAGDAEHEPSPATASAAVTTPKAGQEAPAAPEAGDVATTTTTLAVSVKAGQEYSIDGGATWVADDDGDGRVTFDALTPGATYQLVTRLAGDATHDPSPASDALSVTLPLPAGSIGQREVPGNWGGARLADSDEYLAGAVALTDDERAAVEAGADVAVWVEAVDVTDVSGELTDDGKQALHAVMDDGYQAGAYVEITAWLQVGDSEPRQIHELLKDVHVTTALPAGLAAEGRTFAVSREHLGSIARVDADVIDGALTISSDRFSTFEVAYRDAETAATAAGDAATTTRGATALAKTGDPLAWGLVAAQATAMLGLAAAFGALRRRRDGR